MARNRGRGLLNITFLVKYLHFSHLFMKNENAFADNGSLIPPVRYCTKVQGGAVLLDDAGTGLFCYPETRNLITTIFP
jgi:hypothetical protein